MADSNTLKCDYYKTCPGCSLWEINYSEQKKLKTDILLNHFEHLKNFKIDTHFISCGEYGLRQRFDFIIKKNQLGLIHKNKDFIVLEHCLQLTDELQLAFVKLIQCLKKASYTINLGTIRLRVASMNTQFLIDELQIDTQKNTTLQKNIPEKPGLWLDFSNQDIKNLLREKTTLLDLASFFEIEVGQKKKTLNPKSFSEPQIKLSDPSAKKWFHTQNYSDKTDKTLPELKKTPTPLPIYCAISSFTQPSSITAEKITELVIYFIQNQKNLNIYEFGSGLGQYTLPLLSLGHSLYCFENDSFASECLKSTAKENNLLQNLNLFVADFQKNLIPENLPAPDLVLVNPPKSGLKNFSQNIMHLKPKKIIYVSCFVETLKMDSEVFLKNNYHISEAFIVDQFPQTKHFEIVMSFDLIV